MFGKIKPLDERCSPSFYFVAQCATCKERLLDRIVLKLSLVEESICVYFMCSYLMIFDVARLVDGVGAPVNNANHISSNISSLTFMPMIIPII